MKTNTFFCHTCLTDRPLVEQSPDPRYCQHCLDYLNNHEVPLLSNFPIKPRWMPKAQTRETKTPPKNVQKVEAKITTLPSQTPKHFLHTAKNNSTSSGTAKMGRPTKGIALYEKIHQLANNGKNGNEIFNYMVEHREKVSRRTVYNILAGPKTLL